MSRNFFFFFVEETFLVDKTVRFGKNGFILDYMSVKLLKWIELFFLCMLVVGCSQTVSNPIKDDMDENGFALVDGDWEFSDWTLNPEDLPDKKMYPMKFNANLIVAGAYMGTTDGVTIYELAEKIKSRINRALNPGGMAVREVNVLYAKDHPIVGGRFSDAEIAEHDMLSPDRLMDTLALWPGHAGEVSIILGHYIYDGMGEEGVEVGFSPCPGRIYGEDDEGEADYIAIVSHGKREAKRGYTSTQIANVTVHELGHFFGLMHTTEIGGMEFDEYEDTPACPKMLLDGIDECADRNYIMFPLEQNDWAYSTFSPQETDVIRMYLATMPHK